MDASKIASGGSAGAAIGVLLSYLSTRFNWGVTTVDAAVLTAAATACGAFVWHNGLIGIIRTLLHGTAVAVKGSNDTTGSSE